ncbi:MAG: zinc-ribbon domain-containing protein, partial [Sedimentitalea sp.]|nr:zinc-ribbon domain-containing protein [Sedimentitalea sp.]
MRLTCPNCEARYEIPDEVIPLDGRDVECSNCGRIWFQTHADHPEATAADGEDSTGAAESSAEPTHAEEVALAPEDETVAEAAEAAE